MGAYIDIADRVSVSANLNDFALRFAEVIGRASRAGRPNLSELSPEQSQFLVDASRKFGADLVKVDPNDIPGLPVRSHAFWYEDPWVSGDMLAQFVLNADPARRGLEAQSTDSGARYWIFPSDFSDRIVRLMDSSLNPRTNANALNPERCGSLPEPAGDLHYRAFRCFEECRMDTRHRSPAGALGGAMFRRRQLHGF